MKIDRLNRWITLGANLAVFLGVVFLVVEIRQTNEQMRAQTRSDISYAIIDNIKMGMDPRVIAAYQKQETGEPLGAEDEHLLESMANATLRLWENTYYQYRNGLFDDDEFEADLVVWGESLRSPEYQRHWQANRTTYSASFRKEIDRLIE